MTENEIKLKIEQIGYLEFYRYYNEKRLLLNQLQSNWNSLKEELYQANRELVPNELVNGKELINNILDEMNELEGSDKK